MQVGHAREDAPVPFEREIVGYEHLDLTESGIIRQDGAKDESFRIQIGRQAFLRHQIPWVSDSAVPWVFRTQDRSAPGAGWYQCS
jgi:hypothetical protein